jgi:predicted Holliday junction resolvase-like endonuclease
MELVLQIFIHILVFAIIVAVLQWAFEIDKIVSRLKDISISNRDILKTLQDIRESINRTNHSSQQDANDTEITEEI